MHKNIIRLPGKYILMLLVTVLCIQAGRSQSVYLPQSYQFNQKLNADVYSKGNNLHTSLRPFLLDSSLSKRYSQLMQTTVDSSYKSWALRKLFNEHIFDVKKKDYTFYADFLPDNTGGYDLNNKNNPAGRFRPVGVLFKSQLGISTRGFQAGGTVGNKFSFYTSGYESQASFPSYLTRYIDSIGFVPGEGYDRSFGKPHKDYSYVTAVLSYTPIRELNITLGEDKTFIGDGYRSLLLSDYSANMPLLRLTANIGNVQYMAMWAYLQDINEPKFDNLGSNRRKWGIFHYLDWNVNKSLSLGFFNALIAQEADAQGNYHGFDLNYINPVLFASGLGPSNQKDNALVGFTGKYKLFDKTALYGQLLLDRFKQGNVNSTNGWQLGIRGADIFGVKDLNYLAEYNTVKPYTYADTKTITSYTFYSQPLGDPLGANFKEMIGILNYTYKKFDLQGQFNYAKYGLDATSAQNNGKDVNKPITSSTVTTDTGQGLNTSLYYAEGTVSYLINAKYNLRIELSGIYRQEKNTLATTNNTVITFGLRSTFRSLYHDF